MELSVCVADRRMVGTGPLLTGADIAAVGLGPAQALHCFHAVTPGVNDVPPQQEEFQCICQAVLSPTASHPQPSHFLVYSSLPSTAKQKPPGVSNISGSGSGFS